MQIKNLTGIINTYRSSLYEKGNKKVSVSHTNKSKNIDVAEFSSVKSFDEVIKNNVLNATQNDASNDKINELREAISNGTYNTSAETIADSLMQKV